MKTRAQDILKEKGNSVWTINPDSTIEEAVRLMNEKRIGALIVVNAEGEINGIVSERDILKNLASSYCEIKKTAVKVIMTPKEKIIVGLPEDTAEYLMGIMTNNRIRHIPIVGGECKCKLLGVVSIGDLVKAVLKDTHFENKLLKDYFSGGYPS